MEPPPTAPVKMKTGFSLGLAQIKSAANRLETRFAEDGVGHLHGTNSSALPEISTHGVVPVGDRLDAFATDRSLPIVTPEQRKKVAADFHETMSSGERGNTLDAWVKNPSQPIARGISVYDPRRALDTVPYANKGDGSTFPVVLGVSTAVPTRTPRGVPHPLTEGRVAPSDIPVVYVPRGRSGDANTQLQGGHLRARAHSFPDLFEG
jgi:hypothetical protein